MNIADYDRVTKLIDQRKELLQFLDPSDSSAEFFEPSITSVKSGKIMFASREAICHLRKDRYDKLKQMLEDVDYELSELGVEV